MVILKKLSTYINHLDSQPDTPSSHLSPQKVSLCLKQALRAWFQWFAQYATKVGFTHRKSDTSLFVFYRGFDLAYLLLYVDDIILTASSLTLLRSILSSLNSKFSMTYLGLLHYFLGIFVNRDNNGMMLHQRNYVADILHRANMSNCNPCATLVDTSAKLNAEVGPPVAYPTLYRSLAGALQYLTTTRPDIQYAVQQICLYMHDLREPHFHALKRILRYIKETIDHGLHLTKSSSTTLTAYTDTDWTGCLNIRRSTSGFCVYLGDNLISWSSKRQQTVSRSSVEQVYSGVSNAVA